MQTEISSKSEFSSLSDDLVSNSNQLGGSIDSLKATLSNAKDYDGIDVTTAANILKNNLDNVMNDLQMAAKNIKNYIAGIELLDLDDFSSEANMFSLSNIKSNFSSFISEITPDFIENGFNNAKTNINNWKDKLTDNLGLLGGTVAVMAPVTIEEKNNNMIAHRGAFWLGESKYAENTSERFIKTGQAGYWGCETDVRYDNNGNLVCSHNAVKENQQTTSFAEYLDICKEYRVTPVIDLKYDFKNGTHESLSKDIINTINEKGMMNSCIIQTTEPKDIKRIREYSNDARIWYLTTSDVNNTIEIANTYNVEAINYASGVSGNTIQKLNNNGIDVCVYNVQSEEAKARYERYGAKYIMTDNQIGLDNANKN